MYFSYLFCLPWPIFLSLFLPSFPFFLSSYLSTYLSSFYHLSPYMHIYTVFMEVIKCWTKDERSQESEILTHWTAKPCWGNQILFLHFSCLIWKIKWDYNTHFYVSQMNILTLNHALWELQLNNKYEVFSKMCHT